MLDLRDCLPRLVEVEVADDHSTALPGEPEGRCPAETSPAAGNDDDPVVEPVVPVHPRILPMTWATGRRAAPPGHPSAWSPGASATARRPRAGGGRRRKRRCSSGWRWLSLPSRR